MRGSLRGGVVALALSGLACAHTFALPPAKAGCDQPASEGCVEAAPAAKGALRIQNRSKTELCRIHVRPSDESDWTEPVDEEIRIPPGFGYDLHLRSSTWDVKLFDCKGQTVLERLKLPVADSGTALSYAPP